MPNLFRIIFFWMSFGCYIAVGQNISELSIHTSSQWSLRAVDNSGLVLMYGSSAAHMANIKDDSITPLKIFNYLGPDLDLEAQSSPLGMENSVSCFDRVKNETSYYNLKKFDRTKPFIDYLSSKAAFFSKENFGRAVNQIPFFPDWRPSPARAKLFNKKLFDSSTLINGKPNWVTSSTATPGAPYVVTGNSSTPISTVQPPATPASQPVQRSFPSTPVWPWVVGFLILAVMGGVWWKLLRK